jgi:hypothetical protein
MVSTGLALRSGVGYGRLFCQRRPYHTSIGSESKNCMMIKVSRQATPKDDDKTQCLPSHMAHPWDVAVVYDSLDMSSCGHRIRWEQIPPLTCPICEANIVLVGDPVEDIDKKVLFKYNKQIFRLSIQHPKRSWWERIECTAQDRIAYALGMNAKRGMKVRLMLDLLVCLSCTLADTLYSGALQGKSIASRCNAHADGCIPSAT